MLLALKLGEVGTEPGSMGRLQNWKRQGTDSVCSGLMEGSIALANTWILAQRSTCQTSNIQYYKMYLCCFKTLVFMLICDNRNQKLICYIMAPSYYIS
jgi:hypothetical protein